MKKKDTEQKMEGKKQKKGEREREREEEEEEEKEGNRGDATSKWCFFAEFVPGNGVFMLTYKKLIVCSGFSFSKSSYDQ